MMLYYPCAEIKDTEGDALSHFAHFPTQLFTYDACHTIAEARQMLGRWAKDYHLISAWIDCYRNGVKLRKIPLF